MNGCGSLLKHLLLEIQIIYNHTNTYNNTISHPADTVLSANAFIFIE